MNLKLFFLLLFTSNLWALDFVPGSGSNFDFYTEGQKVNLNIYIANRNTSDLSVEFHFGAGGIIPVNMYQQFKFELNSQGSPLEITKGYIKTQTSKSPEIMTKDFFKQNKGVQVEDFLFSKREEIEKFFIGNEMIEIPAGSIMTRHYRKVNNGQTVDFWIAEKVGPISLVKLESKSETNKHANYKIELASLLRNVKPMIDPSKAVPLTEETSKILTKTRK